MNPTLQEKAEGLPTQPGVYVFKDAAGQPIYVGKAKSLRHRVRSYFQEARPSDEKRDRMLEVARLWSTTMLILLGTGWLAWPRFMDLCGVEAVSHEGMVFGAAEAAPDARAEWARDAALALAVWWLVVLVRSGLHYAGPPDGPAWQARPPRCTKCGYIIASLALDGKCPECGYPVRESLARLEKMGLFTRWKAFRASVRAAFGRG